MKRNPFAPINVDEDPQRGYPEEDAAFYERAVRQLERDLGPRRSTLIDVEPLPERIVPEVGSVQVTRIDVEAARAAGLWPPASVHDIREAQRLFTIERETQEPYSSARVKEIIEGGRVAPRLLNLEQSRRATKNREQFTGHRQQLEQWHGDVTRTTDSDI